jgi:hypothetical protein
MTPLTAHITRFTTPSNCTDASLGSPSKRPRNVSGETSNSKRLQYTLQQSTAEPQSPVQIESSGDPRREAIMDIRREDRSPFSTLPNAASYVVTILNAINKINDGGNIQAAWRFIKDSKTTGCAFPLHAVAAGQTVMSKLMPDASSGTVTDTSNLTTLERDTAVLFQLAQETELMSHQASIEKRISLVMFAMTYKAAQDESKTMRRPPGTSSKLYTLNYLVGKKDVVRRNKFIALSNKGRRWVEL